MTGERDPAVARFAVLQMMRLSGVVLLLLGVLIIAGKAPAFLSGLPEAAGYALALIGLADFVVVPHMLARRWRTPRR
ncbi:hypothetical protein NOLU111490_07135 [Novosphingobium lubricantis]|jgi:hypothetical protein